MNWINAFPVTESCPFDKIRCVQLQCKPFPSFDGEVCCAPFDSLRCEYLPDKAQANSKSYLPEGVFSSADSEASVVSIGEECVWAFRPPCVTAGGTSFESANREQR